MVLDRYAKYPNGMEKIQGETEVGPVNIMLAWTPQWLLSPVAIADKLIYEETYVARTMITIICTTDKKILTKKAYG